MRRQAGARWLLGTLGISWRSRLVRAAKYLGALLLGVILLYAFVVNFSAVESRFQCSGEISQKGVTKPSTAFVKLTQYRWWVGLWSDSDAALWLEIPNETVEYFEHVARAGDQLQIFGRQKDLKGQFSILSKTLALSTPLGFFDGTCKKIDA